MVAYLWLEPVPKKAQGPIMPLVLVTPLVTAKLPVLALLKVSVAPVWRVKVAAVLLIVKALAELFVQVCAPARFRRTLLPATPLPKVTAPAPEAMVIPPAPSVNVRAVPPPVIAVVPVLLKVMELTA